MSTRVIQLRGFSSCPLPQIVCGYTLGVRHLSVAPQPPKQLQDAFRLTSDSSFRGYLRLSDTKKKHVDYQRHITLGQIINNGFRSV
jgi:hypothetical protein